MVSRFKPGILNMTSMWFSPLSSPQHSNCGYWFWVLLFCRVVMKPRSYVHRQVVLWHWVTYLSLYPLRCSVHQRLHIRLQSLDTLSQYTLKVAIQLCHLLIYRVSHSLVMLMDICCSAYSNTTQCSHTSQQKSYSLVMMFTSCLFCGNAPRGLHFSIVVLTNVYIWLWWVQKLLATQTIENSRAIRF